MKTKLITTVFAAIFLFSCNFKENDVEVKSTELTKKASNENSFISIEKEGYKGQLSYLKTNNGNNNSNELAMKFDFKNKIKDEKTTWEYFDNLYNDNLTSVEKQDLAFIILSSKDLIGVYGKNKGNKELENKMVFYTKYLVNSDYIGYCLLYNCFDVLKSTNPELVKELATKVANYSKKDTFHEEVINNETLKNNEKMNTYYTKILEDFSYLNKIKSLI